MTRIILLIEQGWSRLVSNSKLLFIGVILFVFPLLFIVVLEQFYAVAAANVQTAEQARIGALHDAVQAAWTAADQAGAAAIEQIVAANADITKFRLYEASAPDEVTTIASANQTEVGSTSPLVATLQTSQINPGETFSIQLESPNGRVVQAVRLLPGDTDQYIFSEHQRGSFDTVLAQRKLDAYLMLSIIFLFLLLLAYWIQRQTDWYRRYRETEQILRERDLFSNMIAHEFRTPLTAIKGYASMMQESATLSAEDRRFTDTIRESAERLVLLVNDFLEIARIQSGRMNIEITNTELSPIIETVISTTKPAATDKGLQLEYSKPASPQLLHTDAKRLTQALTNIVTNAIKYTEEGSIAISTKEDKRSFEIIVQDTGMGITAQDQQKLFAPFSRVGGVDQTATTGTGLGMWITKQLVELLGGQVFLESISGVGTRVVLRFKKTD